jgi:regulatory protein
VPERVQDKVLDKLSEGEWLDDEAFAHAWVENRTEYRPRGAFALKAELTRKGILAKDIRAALEQFDETDAAQRAAQQAAHKYQHLSKVEFRRRVGAYLQRRGFRLDLIHSAVERSWREADPNESEDSQ